MLCSYGHQDCIEHILDVLVQILIFNTLSHLRVDGTGAFWALHRVLLRPLIL